MGPADYAAMANSNDGWGGGGASWLLGLFAILALVGGNGFFGNRGNWGYQPQYATQDFVQNGFNFNDLQDQNRDLMGAITGGTAQTVAAANQVFHDTYAVLSDKYGELQRDIAGLAVGQANQIAAEKDCCCQTLRAIDGVNYNGALNTAQIVQAIQQDGAATRAAMQQDKYEQLQMKYQDLNQRMNTQEMMGAIGAATANVVRYPNAFVYSAGPSPFCAPGWGPNGNM